MFGPPKLSNATLSTDFMDFDRKKETTTKVGKAFLPVRFAKKSLKHTWKKSRKTSGAVVFRVDVEKARGVKKCSNVTPVDVSGLDMAQRNPDLGHSKKLSIP